MPDSELDAYLDPPKPRKARPTSPHLDELTQFAKENNLTVGSTTGGRHNAGSLHYSGNAIDIKGSGGFDDSTVNRLTNLASERGLKLRDERTHPRGQKVWGGPHVHLEYAGDGQRLGELDDYLDPQPSPSPAPAPAVPKGQVTSGPLAGGALTSGFGTAKQPRGRRLSGPTTIDAGNAEPIVPRGAGYESPRKAVIRRGIQNERGVLQAVGLPDTANPITQIRRLMAGTTPEQDVEAETSAKFQSEQDANVERQRLIAQLTPSDLAEISDFTNHLQGKGRVYSGVRAGIRSGGSSGLYKLAGLADIANAVQKSLTGQDSWIPDYLKRKALAGELSVDDIPAEQRNQLAEFLAQSAVGLAEVAAAPGGAVSKFAGLAGTEAIGRGKSRAEVAKETAKGATIGGVFKGGEGLAPAGAGLGRRIATTAPAVGVGTLAAETAFGTPLREAGISAVTNAAFGGLGELAKSRQRFQSLQFGEVEVTESQQGARRGKLRVAEVDNPEAIHYVKKADAQGRGNAQLLPIKPTKPESTETAVPPIPEGHTRFYRADAADATEPQGAGWVARDPEYASQKYGKGQMGSESVWYRDAPNSEIVAEYGDHRSASILDKAALDRMGGTEPKLFRRTGQSAPASLDQYLEPTTPDAATQLAATKAAFKLPFIESTPENNPHLQRPFNVTYESESGRKVTRATTIEKRQRKLKGKQRVIDQLLDCIHG